MSGTEDRDSEMRATDGVRVGVDAQMDPLLYAHASKDQYDTSIAPNEEDVDEDADMTESQLKKARWNRIEGHDIVEQSRREDMSGDADVDPMDTSHRQIQARMSDYNKQMFEKSKLTAARKDMFSSVLSGDSGAAAAKGTSYREVMKQTLLGKERSQLERLERDQLEGKDVSQQIAQLSAATAIAKSQQKLTDATQKTLSKTESKWKAEAAATPGLRTGSRWDATPAVNLSGATPVVSSTTPGLGFGATPGGGSTPHRGSRTPGLGWNDTPAFALGSKTPAVGFTPSSGVTPFGVGAMAATPAVGGVTPRRWDATPSMSFGATPTAFAAASGTPMATPAMGGAMGSLAALQTPATPSTYAELREMVDFEARNRPWTDELLDKALDGVSGYEILDPPASYVPTVSFARSMAPTPCLASSAMGGGFTMDVDTPSLADIGLFEVKSDPSLPCVKQEDYKYFGELVEKDDDSVSDASELKRRMILKLILKVKNGTPPQRKVALRQLTERALWFGADALFDTMLPLLMATTLDDLERHLLVKVVDRVLYKLGHSVGPHVHNILVVIEPLLIDEDYYARVEGREIIANLAKAAGLAKMISVMRPHIDHSDEYVRNTTARAFSVVASALGIAVLLPFLKAVCQSRRSWEARHTGIKIVQQMAILMGCAVLPHLNELVEIIEHGLDDSELKVRSVTALSLAALAEASQPYGFDAFTTVIAPLLEGCRSLRGKSRAACLKAFGFIVPLGDAQFAAVCVSNVMPFVVDEFESPEEEIRKIVLKVVRQLIAADGVDADYVLQSVMPPFFRHFWNRRMALDRRNYRQLVDTTAAIAQKVGGSVVIAQLVKHLLDENEAFRKMVIESIDKIVSQLGAADIDDALEEQLFDGILYAFQELSSEDTSAVLCGFGAVMKALALRCKPYLHQIVMIVKPRLQHPSMRIRQTAAELVTRVAPVVAECKEQALLSQIGTLLFELLGEEYPDVLASMLAALFSVLNAVGMDAMEPPVKDIVLRLTPILKNRNAKVQENCVHLVGRIAERCAEAVSPKEWTRIAHALLEMLKAHKKSIRRAAVNTLGYIAKAVGPQEVVELLLDNLRVQERQNRVCTTIAVAVVADTCGAFTVLPALMNEYRVPELNVRTGVLKSLSFMFEYLGDGCRDYVYPTTCLLEDALTDRDIVHRQMACAVVKHLALGVYGLGCEDALMHLLNLLWPNVFETTPHLVQTFTDAVDALRLALGPAVLFQYIVQGLFHPAKKVRTVYWRLYNLLYVGSQDALVAVYPLFCQRLPIDTLKGDKLPPNDYTRHEMLYFV